jgi:3-oxoacyl-[acyl-carrier protein] reductase
VIVNYATSKSGAERIVATLSPLAARLPRSRAISRNPTTSRDVYAEIKSTHGRLDVLVNNAGVYAYGPIEEVTVEEYRLSPGPTNGPRGQQQKKPAPAHDPA